MNNHQAIFYVIALIIGLGITIALLGLIFGADDVSGQEIMMCFATKQLADDFLKQFPQHASHNIVVGCPEFNIYNQTVDNESGK